MRTVDVVVMGGGPAGAVCGSLLRRAGQECVVIDHASFPRDKICGGGLTPKAWRLLEQLLPDLKYDYSPVHHMKLQFEQDRACEFDAELELRMTNRRDFDASLIRYYQECGGELLKGSFARYEELPDGKILVTLKSGQQIACRYLVAADGANSMVRRQMFGKYEDNVFFIEQYAEQTGDREIFVHFSRDYFLGCFYKFPGIGRDVWGFHGPETNRENFQRLLMKFGAPTDGRIVGAFIPLKVVESTHEHIMFIGDAGGFPNRITGEGLYDAFKTAYHATRAIVEQKPFSETNKQVFEKMKREDKLFRFSNTPLCPWLFRVILRFPRLTKAIFDAKMKRETLLNS